MIARSLPTIRGVVSLISDVLKFTLLLALFATLADSAEVKLAWDPSIGADGYRVYFGPESRNYFFYEDLGDQTEYTITALEEGQKYYFAVTAFNSYGESDYSEEVAYTPGTVTEPSASAGTVPIVAYTPETVSAETMPEEVSVEDLIEKYYNDILDRPPEGEGLIGWAEEIQRITEQGVDVKQGFIAMGQAFFSSAEYFAMNKTNVQYITDLYETFLNRTASSQEITSWVAYLESGASRNMLLTNFARSEEFALFMENTFGNSPVQPESNLVSDLYQGFYGRLPDSGGMQAWVDLLSTAKSGGSQAIRNTIYHIVLSHVQSAEYALMDRVNSRFVEDLYNAILGRGAMPEEVGYWADILDSDVYTRIEVLNELINSDEFQFRVQEILDSNETH
ncbi:MAG: DUF4214 domain-containing protein [Desulfobacterales bacterium]|nr:MAG: DUF4214 domain-containing protein [Desulfobacterales bacterium]